MLKIFYPALCSSILLIFAYLWLQGMPTRGNKIKMVKAEGARCGVSRGIG